jgi:hypothetical protein
MEMIQIKILEHYTDKYGFMTAKHKSESDPDNGVWDTENNHLWTGQINILLRYNNLIGGYFEDRMRRNFLTSLDHTEIYMGLHTRHAPINVWMQSPEWDAISLDEHDGMAMSCAALKTMWPIQQIYQYGEKHGWSYIEKPPFEQAWPKTLRGWLNLFKGVSEVLMYAIKSKDYRGSRAMDQIIFKHQEVENLSRIRLPKDRYFIKRIAGHEPNWLDRLHFKLTVKKTLSDARISGKNRLVFRLLALRLVGLTDFEEEILQEVHVELTKQFGYSYVNGILKNYLWNPDNPMFELSKGLTLKSPVIMF